MIAGVDEAGRGPVIGPLVVCGVAVENDRRLRELGVRDSKTLSPKRRETLAAEIRRIARVKLVDLPAKEIDLLMEEMNLNAIEAKLFATVLERLDVGQAYIDSADTSERRFETMILRELRTRPRLIVRHKADALYPVVSAASIIAKVERDRRVRAIEEELGVEIGSGYPSDRVTIAFLERYVADNGTLPPHTRHSWKTSCRLLSKAQGHSLDEFSG